MMVKRKIRTVSISIQNTAIENRSVNLRYRCSWKDRECAGLVLTVPTSEKIARCALVQKLFDVDQAFTAIRDPTSKVDQREKKAAKKKDAEEKAAKKRAAKEKAAGKKAAEKKPVGKKAANIKLKETKEKPSKQEANIIMSDVDDDFAEELSCDVIIEARPRGKRIRKRSSKMKEFQQMELFFSKQ
eukprot:912643_1